MATKDWKLVTKNNTFTTWQNKERDLFITIAKQNYNEKAWGYKKPINYPVKVGTCSVNQIEKTFKTKKEALKFVKNYIRKN